MEPVRAATTDARADPWQRLVAVGSILSVLLVAVGLYITNEANREQQRLTAQGQITDRFARSVEQLGLPGTEKLDVRLGAVYALERIMRDSAEDQPAVVDILAAFVRVHSPAPEPAAPPPMVRRPWVVFASPERLPVDVQAALTVLGRRDVTRDRGVDLTNTNLASANLNDANLTAANLRGADLTLANLSNAKLSRANLSDANLSLAGLTHADLTHADLTRATLAAAFLSDADLSGARLNAADLGDAFLRGADLTGANLDSTDLSCAVIDDRTRLPAGAAGPAPCS